MTWHGHPLLVMLRPCADLLGSKLQRVGRETDCGPLGAGVSPDMIQVCHFIHQSVGTGKQRLAHLVAFGLLLGRG